MIARVFLASHPAVYATVRKPLPQFRREQEVVQAHTFVERPPFALVIPERPERPVWLQLAQSIGPSLSKQARKGLAATRLYQRVVV